MIIKNKDKTSTTELKVEKSKKVEKAKKTVVTKKTSSTTGKTKRTVKKITADTKTTDKITEDVPAKKNTNDTTKESKDILQDLFISRDSEIVLQQTWTAEERSLINNFYKIQNVTKDRFLSYSSELETTMFADNPKIASKDLEIRDLIIQSIQNDEEYKRKSKFYPYINFNDLQDRLMLFIDLYANHSNTPLEHSVSETEGPYTFKGINTNNMLIREIDFYRSRTSTLLFPLTPWTNEETSKNEKRLLTEHDSKFIISRDKPGFDIEPYQISNARFMNSSVGIKDFAALQYTWAMQQRYLTLAFDKNTNPTLFMQTLFEEYCQDAVRNSSSRLAHKQAEWRKKMHNKENAKDISWKDINSMNKEVEERRTHKLLEHRVKGELNLYLTYFILSHIQMLDDKFSSGLDELSHKRNHWPQDDVLWIHRFQSWKYLKWIVMSMDNLPNEIKYRYHLWVDEHLHRFIPKGKIKRPSNDTYYDLNLIGCQHFAQRIILEDKFSNLFENWKQNPADLLFEDKVNQNMYLKTHPQGGLALSRASEFSIFKNEKFQEYRQLVRRYFETKLHDTTHHVEEETFETSFINRLKRMEGLQNNGLSGIVNPYLSLSHSIPVFKRGSITIAAARPGIGKTSFCIDFCARYIEYNMAQKERKDKIIIFFYPLETSRETVLTKLLSNISKVSYRRIEQNNLSDREKEFLMKVIKMMDGGGVEVIKQKTVGTSDTAQGNIVSAQHIEEDLRYKAKSGRKPDIIIVDYIQLAGQNVNASHNMETDKAAYFIKDGREKLNETIRILNNVAQEFNAAMIWTSQINREGTQADTIGLEHLSESAELERVAENVLVLDQPLKGLISVNSKHDDKDATSVKKLETMKRLDHPSLSAEEKRAYHALSPHQKSAFQSRILVTLLKVREGDSNIQPFFFTPDFEHSTLFDPLEMVVSQKNTDSLTTLTHKLQYDPTVKIDGGDSIEEMYKKMMESHEKGDGKDIPKQSIAFTTTARTSIIKITKFAEEIDKMTKQELDREKELRHTQEVNKVVEEETGTVEDQDEPTGDQ